MNVVSWPSNRKTLAWIDRDALGDRRVVQEVAGLERVGPVDDHVVAVDDPLDVLGDEHLLVGHDVHVGVEGGDRLARRLDLPLADPLVRVEDLALEVRQVDDVEVDDPDRADAGGREIERGRASRDRRRR